MGERTYTKSQLKQWEQEVIETHDLLRVESNPISKIAKINRHLIEIINILEKSMFEIESCFPLKLIVQERTKRPIKTTIKALERALEKLKKINDVEDAEVIKNKLEEK